jgi:hypothetical protein
MERIPRVGLHFLAALIAGFDLSRSCHIASLSWLLFQHAKFESLLTGSDCLIPLAVSQEP